MSDAASLATLVGAIAAALGALLGVIATKGVDAINKLRRAKADVVMEERKYEDSQEAVAFQQATAAYDKLIVVVEARVKTLETALVNVGEELKKSRLEHVNCLVEQERIRGDLKALQVHVDRLWSHDKATKDQIAENKASIEKVEQRNLKGNDQ